MTTGLSQMTPDPHLSKSQEEILVITGEDLRHQYFVNQLNAHFPLVAVLTETASYPPPLAASEEEKQAWDWFFTRRAQYESKVFEAVNKPLNKPPVIKIPKGQLNSPETLQTIKRFNPGFIAIFGIGMLRESLLSQFPGRIFNLHVGLPGFYRGSSCNFWPIYEKQLDKLGAAVHLANEGIDKGQIAAQAAIELDCKDDEQSLACKTLLVGVQLMIATITNWQHKTLNLSPLTKPGKLYLRKEFTPHSVLRVRQMVESGELTHQLKLIKERKSQAEGEKI
jgi:phosphoribosylglycinamide formyltransferase 1